MQWLRVYGPSVQLPANLSFSPPSLSLDIFPCKEQIHTRAKKMMKIIIAETKDRTHKQSMRFFCLLFHRKPTLSEVCWASRAPVTHTRFPVGFTRWHSADRKLQVANRRSISNLYQTQVWYLRCPETLFISHEHANFLFSVFSVAQGEAKTPKIMGCCRAIYAFLLSLKIGTFRGKWTLEWVFKTSQFFRLALYFLINSKLAFSLHVSERCLTGNCKKILI